MKTVIVIPARYGSTRFPGKPLKLIKGKSLLERTCAIAKAVKNVEGVFVATDDERIAEHAEQIGATPVMTGECENGTERVWQAIQNIGYKPDAVINLQGDAVLTPPWIIQAIVDAMDSDPAVQLATPATQLTWEQYEKLAASKSNGVAGGTTVTFDKNNNALYFSKALIPFLRDKKQDMPPVFRHIGLYGYRYECLKNYLQLQPTPLEQSEKLEQLRALENGIPIKVVLVDYKGRSHWAIDSPDDVTIAESIIEKEGELV
ncbi:MAG: 3-deoxy-manno-octulosonate cytidylyltransferase [Candidatus Obscuribacterales bacterium]|nr:3-deoxy-manno-octulosonate cytidylyltransferase [Candidatus Obscuribacterales bacterium]